MTVIVDPGRLRQVGTLSTRGAAVADGDGGYTQPSTALDPATWRFSMERASVRSAERHFSATVISQATYIMRGRFHPAIDTKTVIAWVDRNGDAHTANVIDTDDTEGAGVETVVAATEVVT
jgi:hypothetical protein